MNEFSAKEVRKARTEKARRLAHGESAERVDASDFTPAEPLNANAKTGMRPISKRQFKRGGCVEGEETHHHSGRRHRKSGGGVNDFINRDVRAANHEIAKPRVGGFKKGGRPHRDMGGANPVPTTALNLSGRNVGAAGMGGIGSGRKHGGKIRHPDEAADRQLVHEMVDKRCLRARGGNAGHGDGKWIDKAIKHPGSLRKTLHVKEGHRIPAKTLEKATHSSNPTTGRRARLAETLGHMHHSHPGKGSGGSSSEEFGGTRPTGGRIARKAGGRAKGKTNINIVVNPHGGPQGPGDQGAPMMRPPAPPMTPPMPVAVPPTGAQPMPMPAPGAGAGAPPAGPGGPGGMPMGPPMGMPNQIPRRSGGRTVFPDMEFGAGGGKGRLEKIDEYGPKSRR